MEVVDVGAEDHAAHARGLAEAGATGPEKVILALERVLALTLVLTVPNRSQRELATRISQLEGIGK